MERVFNEKMNNEGMNNASVCDFYPKLLSKFENKSYMTNPIVEKSYSFSVRIVGCYKLLVQERKEYILSKQLLRSATSIGANVEESQGGQSKKDFTAKLQIAYKEAKETHYWLRLLRDTNYLNEKESNSLLADCEELIKILVSILKSSKGN